MNRSFRKLALAAILILVVASFLGSARKEPRNAASILAGAQIPPEVRSLIDRSCRDCHSDATRYPWYSRIAPVSWLIRRDVERGRQRLNLSKWGEYTLIRRQRFLSEIANQVQDGGMPLAIYTLVHRDARLTRADVDSVFEWTQAERARLIAEGASKP